MRGGNGGYRLRWSNLHNGCSGWWRKCFSGRATEGHAGMLRTRNDLVLHGYVGDCWLLCCLRCLATIYVWCLRSVFGDCYAACTWCEFRIEWCERVSHNGNIVEPQYINTWSINNLYYTIYFHYPDLDQWTKLIISIK